MQYAGQMQPGTEPTGNWRLADGSTAPRLFNQDYWIRVGLRHQSGIGLFRLPNLAGWLVLMQDEPDSPDLPADTPTAENPPPGEPVSPDGPPPPVLPPAPVLTALDPATVEAGAADALLTATGSDFAADSVIRFGGADFATTYASAESLTTTIPAASLAEPLTVPVTVATPGAGESAALDFTITEPPPPPAQQTTRRR